MDPSGHFFDQHGGQTVLSQFLVNTQKVDFSHFGAFALDLDGERDGADERHYFLGGLDLDRHEPVGEGPGGREGPFEEIDGVVEAEHGVVVL